MSSQLLSRPPGPVLQEQPSWLRLPTMNMQDGEILDWIRTHFRPESPRRRWQTQRAALNLWCYLGRQWLEPLASLTPAGGGYAFREIYRQSTAVFPRPVTNYIAPSVDNEVARLARKEYVPDPTPTKQDPRYMAAARLAKDILLYEMDRKQWDEAREQLIFNSVIEGVAILRTWWDENNLENTLVASPEAMTCPSCARKFSSPWAPAPYASLGIPNDQGGRDRFHHSETMLDAEPPAGNDPGHVKMQHCPFCEGVHALQPFEMSEEEAGSERDSFGRPLGLYVPRGESVFDVLNIHQFYPENAGIGVEPHQQRVKGQITVRPLEWLAIRFPELAPHIVREDPARLLRFNPLFSDTIFHGHGNGFGLGSGWDAYDNHARLIELVVEPQPIQGLELGAHFAMVNDHIARRPLCIEVETAEGQYAVSRIKYHFARSKKVPQNFYARSFVDDQIPLNKRLNELDAQGVDLRERGKPNMWVPQGTDLLAKDDAQGSFTIIEYDAELAGWSPKDGLFPGLPMNASPYEAERAAILRDLQALGAPPPIERGEAPGSVKTTSGLMLLSEEASRQRDFRERALVRLYEDAFQHFLEMQWAFRKEDATYAVRGSSSLWEERCYTGSDLLGSYQIKMEARIGYDQTLYNKEAAAEAMQLGLYRLDSPDAVDRILDLMKLPKDVNERSTFQITRAEQAWADFVDTQEVRAIDQTMDDPRTWHAVLSKRWTDDDGYEMQRKAGWNKLLPRLTLWDQKLRQALALEAMSKPIYSNFPPAQWPQIQQELENRTAQVQAQVDQAARSQQNVTASASAAGQPPPAAMAVATPPPVPTPPPLGFLPDALELQIYTIWRRMLPELDAALLAASQAQELREVMQPDESAENVKLLDKLLQERAVIEAYRMLATGTAPVTGGPPGAGAPAVGGPALPGLPPPGGAPGGPGMATPAAGPVGA